MTETSEHIPKKSTTKVIIKKSTIDQILAERKKRKQLKDRMKRIQKKNKKIQLKCSLEHLVAIKKKHQSELVRSNFISRQLKHFGVKTFDKPIAVTLIRHPRTAIQEIKKILNEIGVERVMQTKIVVGNEDMLKKLNVANLYVTYGPVNAETIRQLILKRGRIITGENESSPITGNALVKQAFAGKVDSIECIEDLVDEIAHGQHLNEIFSVLCAFTFSGERFRNVRNNHLGGVSGLRENGMDEWLLERI